LSVKFSFDTLSIYDTRFFNSCNDGSEGKLKVFFNYMNAS